MQNFTTEYSHILYEDLRSSEISFLEKYHIGENEYEDFMKLLADLVGTNFRKAVEVMEPLLETVPINNITIKLILSDRSEKIAAYSSASDRNAGNHIFEARAGLLEGYLRSAADNNIPLSQGATYVWHHELIHMLDNNIMWELGNDRENPLPTEILVRFMLSFRTEGIAQFFEFMRHHGKYRSIKAARTRLRKELESLCDMGWDEYWFLNWIYDRISGEEYYTIGTWMVVHVLGCEAYRNYTPEAAELAVKIRKRAEMGDEEILHFIRMALEVDNYSFLDCLTKPGPDALPFADPEDLKDLARFVELCEKDHYRDWSRSSQKDENSDFMKLFRLLRPKPNIDWSRYKDA